MGNFKIRKRIILISIVTLVICFLLIFYNSFLRTKKINRTYNAVIINVSDNSLVDMTTVKLTGVLVPKCPLIRKEAKIEKAHLYVDYFKYTMDDNTYLMDDIYWDKLNEGCYYTPIQYSCLNTTKNPFDNDEQYTELGGRYILNTWLYSNNTNGDKIVIPVDRTNSNSERYNQYIVAPATILDEGLRIYNEVMGRK